MLVLSLLAAATGLVIAAANKMTPMAMDLLQPEITKRITGPMKSETYLQVPTTRGQFHNYEQRDVGLPFVSWFYYTPPNPNESLKTIQPDARFDGDINNRYNRQLDVLNTARRLPSGPGITLNPYFYKPYLPGGALQITFTGMPNDKRTSF